MTERRAAVTQRVVENTSYSERRDALDQAWARLFAATAPGTFCVPVPNGLDTPIPWIEALAPQVLVLTGGNDWGEAPERDRTELALVQWFRERGLPILGVCRGLHVLNIAFGGGLCTDIAGSSGTNHVATEHPVALAGEPFLGWAGASRITVNSYHGQGVLAGQLAADLRPFAVADGDVVEGCIHPDEPILAMQWHPERANAAAAFDRRLMTALLADGPFWKDR